eukprot:3469286-Pleurochrysis_carterae.AAC.1
MQLIWGTHVIWNPQLPVRVHCITVCLNKATRLNKYMIPSAKEDSCKRALRARWGDFGSCPNARGQGSGSERISNQLSLTKI